MPDKVMSSKVTDGIYLGLSHSTAKELEILGLIPITMVAHEYIMESLTELAVIRKDILKLNPDYDLEKLAERIKSK